MGDPSTLRFVPAESSTTPIDWSKIPEASKKFLLKGWSENWETGEMRPLPATIGDLAKMVNEYKFFGYMGSELCVLLLDISELGLAPSPVPVAPAAGEGSTSAQPGPPRFYMRYLGEVWFLILFPGKRNGVVGCSPSVRGIREDEDDDAYEESRVAEELEMVEKIDARLKLGGGLTARETVRAIKNMPGCEASTLLENLETAQYASAMMSLPWGHPAKNMFWNSIVWRR